LRCHLIKIPEIFRLGGSSSTTHLTYQQQPIYGLVLCLELSFYVSLSACEDRAGNWVKIFMLRLQKQQLLSAGAKS
jgi:hypothetical protein